MAAHPSHRLRRVTGDARRGEYPQRFAPHRPGFRPVSDQERSGQPDLVPQRPWYERRPDQGPGTRGDHRGGGFQWKCRSGGRCLLSPGGDGMHSADHRWHPPP